MKVIKVTMLGHKDHGKSTLIGNLAILTGSATEYRINEAKKTSEELGLQFEPGFILDSFEEERRGGLTIDTTRAQVKHGNSAFEFIDVPGHEELTKNMISGASYADVALLVVSAKRDEGIKPQTKRHIFIAKMLGIRNFVVAVNKMDLCDYDEKEFKDVEHSLSSYLKKLGFEKKNMAFIPVSAYTGENLVKKSGKMVWYTGPCLIDVLSALSKPAKNTLKGVVVSLQGFVGGQHDLVSGAVLLGTVRKGSTLRFLPSESSVKVSEMFVRGKKVSTGKVGESIAIKMGKPLKGEVRGGALFDDGIKVEPRSKLDVIIFSTRTLSKTPDLLINGIGVGCKSFEITAGFDITTGERSKVTKLGPLSAAYATAHLKKEVVVLPFEQVPTMGRFVVYDKNKFAGIGMVL